MGMQRTWGGWACGVLIGALLWGSASTVHARGFAEFDLTIAGLDLTVGPSTQSVPKGVTSTVTTQLTLPQVSLPVASLQKLLPHKVGDVGSK